MPPNWVLANEVNQSGELDGLVIYLASQEPYMMPAILAFIYLLIAVGTFVIETKRREVGNIPGSMTVAGVVTGTIAFILFLKPGIVNIQTVSFIVALTVGSALLFFLSGKE